MNVLATENALIQSQLCQNSKAVVERRRHVLYYDCTNFFFEIEEAIIVCTDTSLSSKVNRKYNDLSLGGKQIRKYITTQSVKQLPEYLKDFALGTDGLTLLGDDQTEYDLSKLDEELDFDRIFYKERWIKEDQSGRKLLEGAPPRAEADCIFFPEIRELPAKDPSRTD